MRQNHPPESHPLQSAAAGPVKARVEREEAVVAAVVAALLGFFILYGVGFATIPALHNAAHDARHSFAFPCH
ncbi:MAG: CbtB domain-containing protein [Alphaproteobacteria bacterium]